MTSVDTTLFEFLKDVAREDDLLTINRRSYRFKSFEILTR